MGSVGERDEAQGREGVRQPGLIDDPDRAAVVLEPNAAPEFPVDQHRPLAPVLRRGDTDSLKEMRRKTPPDSPAASGSPAVTIINRLQPCRRPLSPPSADPVRRLDESPSSCCKIDIFQTLSGLPPAAPQIGQGYVILPLCWVTLFVKGWWPGGAKQIQPDANGAGNGRPQCNNDG